MVPAGPWPASAEPFAGEPAAVAEPFAVGEVPPPAEVDVPAAAVAALGEDVPAPVPDLGAGGACPVSSASAAAISWAPASAVDVDEPLDAAAGLEPADAEPLVADGFELARLPVF